MVSSEPVKEMISKFVITLMVFLGLLSTPPLLAVSFGPNALTLNTLSQERSIGSAAERYFTDPNDILDENYHISYYELPLGYEIDESELQELKNRLFKPTDNLPSGEEKPQSQEASVGPGTETLPSEIPEEKFNATYHEPPLGYEIDESELQELKNRPFKPADNIPTNEEDKEPDPSDETGRTTNESGF